MAQPRPPEEKIQPLRTGHPGKAQLSHVRYFRLLVLQGIEHPTPGARPVQLRCQTDAVAPCLGAKMVQALLDLLDLLPIRLLPVRARSSPAHACQRAQGPDPKSTPPEPHTDPVRIRSHGKPPWRRRAMHEAVSRAAPRPGQTIWPRYPFPAAGPPRSVRRSVGRPPIS